MFVAHGIWPLSDQRALRKGVVPSQMDIKEAVLTARQEQRTDETGQQRKTLPPNTHREREIDSEASAESWRERDLLELTAKIIVILYVLKLLLEQTRPAHNFKSVLHWI